MRTRTQEIARFRWLNTRQVADALNCDEDLVREHIHEGSFPDVGGEPGVIDIGSGKMPHYRINPESFRLFLLAKKVA